MPLKTLLPLLALNLLFINNSIAQSNIAAIQIHIENAPKESILVVAPLNGKYFEGTRYYDTTDEAGNLNIYLDIPKAGFCYLYPQYIHSTTNDWTGIQLYIEPGESYQINMDMYDATNTITFGGDNVLEHDLINQHQRKWLADELEVSDWVQEYLEGKTAQEIHLEWSIQRYHELTALQELADKELITLDFVSLMQEDIAYYNAYLFQKLWTAGIMFQADQKAEWDAYQDIVIAEKPISNPNALGSMWYLAYCEAYRLHFLEQRHVAEINQKYQRIADFFTIQYQTYKDYFASNIHENILANALFTEVSNNGSQVPVQDMYRSYQSAFQNSAYLPYLKIFFPNIQAPTYTTTIEYSDSPSATVSAPNYTPPTYTASKGAVATVNFSSMEGVDIIPNQEQINSLSGLLQGFHGKTIYVDIWASWCGPCKKQFEKKAILENYIQDKDIELLYISIDEDKNADNWQQNIQEYGLKGHHIRANPTLLKEVQQRFGQFGILFLPAYGIVNRYGEIVEAKAKKPSDGEALIQQLEKY